MQGDIYNCVVVLGPTASGKTQLAVDIARALQGEIISADSRQVYKGLDLGTGKDLAIYEEGGTKVPHHLIDICAPEKKFYLPDFQEKLRESFSEILARKKLPVICGGTGLYLDALRKDFSLTQVPEDETLRAELTPLPKEELIRRLESYPSDYTTHVDRHSVKRLVRGIEVAEFLQKQPLRKSHPLPYRPYYIGIRVSTAERNQAIAGRLRQRLAAGLLEETQALLQKGLSHQRLQELGLEYKFLSLYILGELTLPEMTNRLETAIRQYAKRQMTWFRRMEKEGVKIHWIGKGEDRLALTEDLRRIFAAESGDA